MSGIWLNKELNPSEFFIQCCATSEFSDAMMASLPFKDLASALTASDAASGSLTQQGLNDALDGHPRIGDQNAHSTWSIQEQSAIDVNARNLLADLRRANVDYEKTFDHVFLICATGKGGEFMLSECKRRLGNDAKSEELETREQLRLINRIRVEKLVNRL
jgi:2-oxo-4-hydroxy-4-carboxy-5-ureidoimidazoline decarboxylase